MKKKIITAGVDEVGRGCLAGPVVSAAVILKEGINLKLLKDSKKITFKKISFPLLILPFLSRSSEIIGKKIYIKFDQIEFLLNLNVNISSNLINQDCPILANNVEIYIIENKDNFTEREWKSLYTLSEETFVKERDSLKQGAAGAGLTDND